MNARTIAPVGAVVQELRLINGMPQKENGDVWCPMCEFWHANETWCQSYPDHMEGDLSW